MSFSVIVKKYKYKPSRLAGSPAPYSQEPDGGDYDYEGGQEAGLQGDQDHDQVILNTEL